MSLFQTGSSKVPPQDAFLYLMDRISLENSCEQGVLSTSRIEIFPLDVKTTQAALPALQCTQKPEALEVFTSPVIVGSPLKVHPISEPEEPNLEKLHCRTFKAIRKIKDQESGGWAIYFRLRTRYNCLLPDDLELSLKRWKRLVNDFKDNIQSMEMWLVFLGFLYGSKLSSDQFRLLMTFTSYSSEEEINHLTLTSFKEKFDSIAQSEIIEKDTKLAAFEMLGYAMEYIGDYILKLPDLRMLNHRLNKLFELNPHLPCIKVDCCTDTSDEMTLVNGYVNESGCADVLLSTEKSPRTGFCSFVRDHMNFLVKPSFTFFFKKSELSTVDIEKIDPLTPGGPEKYHQALAVFRKCVQPYYLTISCVDKMLSRTPQVRYAGGFTYNQLQLSSSMAKVNLAAFVDHVMTRFSLNQLLCCSEKNVGKMLTKETLFGCQYARYFKARNLTFNRAEMEKHWSDLMSFTKDYF